MLGELARWLSDPSGLTPHGLFLVWPPELILLNTAFGAGVGLAYFSIALALFAEMRHRPHQVFRPLFALVAAFSLLCGIGRGADVLSLWMPAYGAQGMINVMAAAVSIVMAVAVWRTLPAIRRIEAVARDVSGNRDELLLELSRRAAADKLSYDSQERFRLLVQSNVTEALYLLDPDGNIETWNTGAERIKGYTPAEIIGQNFSAFFTVEDRDNGVPEQTLGIARATGQFTGEVLRVRKGGGRFCASVLIDAIRREDGTLRGFVNVTRDITSQRIEEAQRTIIAEAAPNGMMVVDEAGVITLANSQTERMFGYPHGELVGQPVERLVPESFHAALRVMQSKLARGQDVRGMTTGREFAGRRRDGTEVSIEILLSPVKTPTGRIVVASLFDVTEKVRQAAEKLETDTRERLAAAATNASLEQLSRHLAQARDRAEQANQAKSRFLASVTHELRTPLHGILGYAELLSLEGGLNPTQSERLEVMMASGQHLLAMINGVLDMSQIEADQVELQPAETELSSLVRVCLDVIRPAAEAKGLKVVEAPAALLPIVVDPTRLRQVLINLLGNAVKFTQAGTIEA